MINGVWLAMGVAVSTATALLGVLISACVFVYELYTDAMHQSAIEKASDAINLIVQKKDYAVFKTTVFWNALPSGYEVDPCACSHR